MRNRTRFSLPLVAILLTSACGSDGNKHDVLDDGGNVVTGERDSGASLDAAVHLDGGGSTIDIDAGSPPDAARPDGAIGSLDGSLFVVDASNGSDASQSDASAPCDVNDPLYGCGTLSGRDWITFPDFEVDLATNVAWTKPATVVDDDATVALCASLNYGGFTWVMPQMEDVRKLAAGCDKTVPGGSCDVYVNQVQPEDSGDCDCPDGLVGPDNGKFCRPEIPECDVLWTWTHVNNTNPYEQWFYDVDTGDIVHSPVGVGIATRAVGRCMHTLAADELPAIATQ